jgi:hypothetical protein
MRFVPRATLDVHLGLPPRVARAALVGMISAPERPVLFRARTTLAGEEDARGLRLWVIPAMGSMALFEARAEVEPEGDGSRVRLSVGPRAGSTSFFWTLGALVLAAGGVMLAFGHLAGAVTLALPLLGWWGRFVAESALLAEGVRAIEGGRRRAVHST